jgi:hypothetical protein
MKLSVIVKSTPIRVLSLSLPVFTVGVSLFVNLLTVIPRSLVLIRRR